MNLFFVALAVGVADDCSFESFCFLFYADVDDAPSSIQEAANGLHQNLTDVLRVGVLIIFVFLIHRLRFCNDFIEIKIGPAAEERRRFRGIAD